MTAAELRAYTAWAASQVYISVACVVRWFGGRRLRRVWWAVSLAVAAAVDAGTAHLAATYDRGMLAGSLSQLVCTAGTVALPPLLVLLYMFKRWRSGAVATGFYRVRESDGSGAEPECSS
jgi:hypothetical protein